LFSDARQFAYPRFSPDGRRILVSRAEAVNDIWVYDVASGTPARVTADQGTSDRGEWTADGKRVVFRSNRTGRNLIWVQPVDRTVAAEPIVDYTNGAP
jgi:Tol biopolymer transport system component